MTDDEIKELINRRRQQVLVHSVLYYRMNTNLISDSQWSEWALDLEELQDRYPELAEQVPRAEMFRAFDHSTGSTLPLEDEWANQKALYLINIENRRNVIR